MTIGQRAAVVQAVAYALLFTVSTSLLIDATETASPVAWAGVGAGMLALLELMAFSVCIHWTGRAVVRCRDCQTVRNINDRDCPRCGEK